MVKLIKQLSRRYFILIIAFILLCSSWIVIARAAPLTAEEELSKAWQQAETIGRYQFNTSTRQTTHPTETLANVGRSPASEQFDLAGKVDRGAETLLLQLWPYGRERGQSILLKQEGGVTYGRTAGAEEILRSAQEDSGQWVASPEAGEIFSQSRDPLRWLAAAKAIRPAEYSSLFPEELLPDSLRGKIKGYQFEIDGPEYARALKTEMEAELRRKGELPAGVNLGLIQQFVDMQGQGELWVSADGLPLRQVLQITFPAQEGASEWVEATIINDFTAWDAQAVDYLGLNWADPGQALPAALRLSGIHPQDAARTIFELGLVLLVLGFVILLFNQRWQRRVRFTFSLIIIASMVAGPLLQVQQLSAFTLRMAERNGENDEDSAAAEPAADQEEVFDPHRDPLIQEPRFLNMFDGQTGQENELSAALFAPPDIIRQAKASACTVSAGSDCDADGLNDHTEIFQLGTWVDQKDSDNDGISDNIEVVGFTLNNRTWYMDPRNPDSNGDGIADGLECPGRFNMSADGQTIDTSVTAVACPDTDGDQVPDVYDFDNDGDGVPDTVDSDPNSYLAVTGQAFDLALSGYQTDKPLLVDLAIRPTDDRHLWWTNNYLDWPNLDQDGQIMRVTDSTLGSDGDMMLSPILEITIPFSAANPSRGLPVKDGVSPANITQTEPLANWLDTDVLDLYGITANLDSGSGAVGLYAPLHLTRDVVGDSPVAWRTQLIYEMPGSSSGWGADHQIKLLWTVNAVVDNCTPPQGQSWSDYCYLGVNGANSANLSHWQTATTIVQTYYDDFLVSGLSVSEEHGAKAAVMAQKAGVSGASPYYEDYLWHLADSLEETFLQAQLVNSSRFSLDDIQGRFPNWGIPAAAISYTQYDNLESGTAMMAKLTGDNIITLLDTIYPSSVNGDTSTLLFAGEKVFRGMSLDQQTDPSFTLNLSGAPTATSGFLRWSPYIYNGAAWTNEDPLAFLDTLGTHLQSVFTQSTIQTVVGGAVDFPSAQAGMINLAQNYYMALVTGGVTWLQDGSTVLSNGNLVDGDHAMPDEPAVAITANLLSSVQDFYTRLSLSNLTLTATLYAELETVASSAWVALSGSKALVLESLGHTITRDTTTSAVTALTQLRYAVHMSGDLSDLLDASALDYTARSTIGLAREHGNIVNNLALIFYSARGVYKVLSAVHWFSDLSKVPRVAGIARALTENYETLLWIGFAIAVGQAIGSFVLAWAEGNISPGSPEFAEKLAYEISNIIVTGIKLVVTLVALSLGVAALTLGILAVIAVIDAVMAIICDALKVDPGSEADQWWCSGITGTLVKALTYVIHDYTPLVDLKHSGRLDMSMETPTITAAPGASATGFAVNNILNITADITSTLYFGHPNWMGYGYADPQLRDDKLGESTFKYELQDSETAIDLNLNGTNWDSIGSGSYEANQVPPGPRFQGQFQAPLKHVLPQAGKNVGQQVSLAEGFAMHAQNCWLAVTVPICGLSDYKDTNYTDLSNDLVFDVFPETLDGLHDLVLVQNNSYRLSWDDAFPTLKDGDNDGLRSGVAGGSDPDDSLPDSDGDGLSDNFEMASLFDPTSADGDGDGLTDYWEAFYLTDPHEADTDGDGLLDSEEVFHPNWVYPYENSTLSNTNPPDNAPSQGLFSGGWEIVYEYQGSTPLKTWVSASPVDADTDQDTISDQREKSYGYNPNAASALNVLTVHSQVQALDGTNVYNAPYVTNNSVIEYSATVTNQLNDRLARGLFESGFPGNGPQYAEELGTLYPLQSASLSNSEAIYQSGGIPGETVNYVMRAGAIIDELPDDRLLWLRMNETPGATTFKDSTYTGYTLNCFYQGIISDQYCPSANGEYLSFQSFPDNTYNQLILASNYNFNMSSFSIGGMVKIDEVGNRLSVLRKGGSYGLYLGEGSEISALINDTPIHTGVFIPAQRWNHIMLTHDGSTKVTNIYHNGNPIWSGTNNVINYGGEGIVVGGPYDVIANTKGSLDEVMVYPRVLTAGEIKARFGAAVVALDFDTLADGSGTANPVTCANSRCPTSAADGGYFDQSQALRVSGQELDFSGDQFTISTWIKPERRSHPFDTAAVSAYNALPDVAPLDTTNDWQGVFGATNTSNKKIIAPTLYINNAGQMRVQMGGGSSTCYVDTASGLITFDSWQHLTISYDGSVFSFYINGRPVAVSSTACAAVVPPSAAQLGHLDIGRANDIATLYLGSINFTDTGDGDGSANQELRINYNDDGSAGNIWQYNGITPTNRSHDANFAYLAAGDGNNWFRMYDDDYGSDTSYDPRDCGNICSHDDDFGQHFIPNYNPYSQTATFSTNQGGADSPAGSYNFTLSNNFFQGSLNEFKVFTKSFSAQGAAKLYEDSYDGLYFPLDEAPGADAFIDGYNDNVRAVCDGFNGHCPKSGLAGIANQTVFFANSNQVVEIEGTSFFENLSNDFTIAAWINTYSVSGVQRILAAGRQNSDNGFGFGIKDNHLLFTTFGKHDYEASSAVVQPGVWQHVAVVFTAQSPSYWVADMYINGVKVQSPAYNGDNGFAAPNSDDPYRIGSTTVSGSSTNAEPFIGLIDDLVIARRAMSAVEIQQLVDHAPVLNLHLDDPFDWNSFTNDGQITTPASGNAGKGDKGQIRDAAAFNGSQSLTVPANSAFNNTNYSIGMWVKPQHTRNLFQGLASKVNGQTYHANFRLWLKNNSLSVRFDKQYSCVNDESQWLWVDAATPLLQNQWNHVMAVHNNVEKTMSLYINGQLSAQKTNINPSVCADSQPIVLGTNYSGGMDEVAYWAEALSGYEVSQLYDYQSRWFDVKETQAFIIDEDNPQVSLDRAVTTVGPQATVMKIAASDPTSNVVAVTYSIDDNGGGAVGNEATNDNGSWLFTWDALTPGSHTLDLTAVDSVGHVGTSSTTIYVDNLEPAISHIANPILIQGQGVTEPSLSLSATIFDGPQGSGVAKNSVSFALYDHNGELITPPIAGILNESAQGFQCAGVFCSYQARFPITQEYYGTYSMVVSAEDNVGNTVTSAPLSFVLDTVGPHADVMILPGTTIQPGTTLQGVASDNDHIWDGRTLHLHFEHEIYNTTFIDPSSNEMLATCDTRAQITEDPLSAELQVLCPATVTAGRFANTASFDGVDDFLVIKHTETGDLPETKQLGLTHGGFTVMAWVNGRNWNDDRVVFGVESVAADDGLLLGLRNGQPLMSFVSSETVSNNTLSTDTWHHIAWRYDEESGEQAIFIDGQLDTAETGHAPFVGTGELTIGWLPGIDSFDGLIDELAVYPFPVTEDRIYDIANPVPAGIADVQIRFRELDADGNEIGISDWFEVALETTADAFTTWSFTVPSSITSGIYKIDMRATDQYGTSGLAALASTENYRSNERIAHNVWTGYATHHQPQRVIFLPVVGGGKR